MIAYTFYETDNRVMRYARTLAGRGDHVDVFALKKPWQKVYERINGVDVYRIQKRVINERGKFSYLIRLIRFLVKSMFALIIKHRRNPYDLVHVHSIPDFEVFAAWYPKLKGCKIILDIHDLLPEFFASKFGSGIESSYFKMLVLVEKVSAGFAHKVIISNDIWGKRLRRSVGDDKCSVILNYPDPELFSPRPKKKDGGRLVMLYPGTLNHHQGVDIAVRALSLIKEEVPGVEFHIYGAGPDREMIAELVKELKLEGLVFMNDFLPIYQIADKMANCDIGLIPKRNDSFGGEAFSTKTLEFMSMGIPIIVSETRIDRHYFNDSVVQFFKPEDERDLAEKMLWLIKNNELRDRLAQNSLKFVQDYTWDKRKNKYLDLVDSLVEKR